jgi:hypothetical protein
MGAVFEQIDMVLAAPGLDRAQVEGEAEKMGHTQHPRGGGRVLVQPVDIGQAVAAQRIEPHG